MVNVDTEDLTAEQKAVAEGKGNMANNTQQGLKAIPEPYRSLMLLLLAAVGMFGGGAAGQSVFGISEAKMEAQLRESFAIQDKVIQAKFDILEAQSAGKDMVTANNSDDIRETLKLVREMDKRLTRLEAKAGVGD